MESFGGGVEEGSGEGGGLRVFMWVIGGFGGMWNVDGMCAVSFFALLCSCITQLSYFLAILGKVGFQHG